MKNVLKLFLFLIGFPALITLVVIESLPVIKSGITYFPYVFGGLIVAVVMGVIFSITLLVTGHKSKKAKTLKKIRFNTAVLAIVGFIATSGLWIIVDQVMPPILEDATSNTIKYVELKENYVEQAEFQGELLNRFIKMNYANQNLDNEIPLDTYLKEGFKNARVKELIKVNSNSLQEGYDSFVGPWLDLANDDRLTIPVLVHLVMNKREISTSPFIFVGEGRGEENGTAPIQWTIMDMQEGSMDFDISGLLSEEILGIINNPLVSPALTKIVDALNKGIAEEELAGSYIYIGLDLDNGAITITPASESRGVWDYMHQAWFASNDLLFLVASLFPLRHYFLMFGGVMLITALLIGFIREKQYGKNLVKEEKPVLATASANGAPYSLNRANPEASPSPYLRAVYNSMEDLNARRGN